MKRTSRRHCRPVLEGLEGRQMLSRGASGSIIPHAIPHVGAGLLDLAASMGLSLLITAGFAAALGLYTHPAPSSPHAIYACGGVFLWSWAVFSCATSPRSRYVGPGREERVELRTGHAGFPSWAAGEQESGEFENLLQEEKAL
jgi:hypothetical protein